MNDSTSPQPVTPAPTLLTTPPATPPSSTTPAQTLTTDTSGNTTNDTTATPPPAPTVPDAYTFKAPEGKTLDAEAIAAFSPIAKELGLSNDAAQRVVDVYNKLAEDQSKLIASAIQAMGEKWMAEAKADPQLGPHLDTARADIGRMFDVLNQQDPALVPTFQREMNITMAGNNPAFIKTLWAMSKLVNEARYVSGAGPAPTGQNPHGTTQRPTAAQAMYGHLINP